MKSIEFEDDVISNLSWDNDHIEISLREAYRYYERKGQNAAAWYLRKKRKPALISRFLRVMAVCLVTIGGLSPLVKSAFPGLGAAWHIDIAQLGYFFLAFAAACMAADRYLGFSTSWARSMLAATAIGVAIEDFRVNWAHMTSLRRGERPSNAQIAEMMALFKTFNSTVQKIIQEETISWDQESRALQSELDATTKTGSAAPKITH